MALPVLVIGRSGSGKTYSIKNLDPETTGVFLVEKTGLPFRKKFPYVCKDATYAKIKASLALHKLPRYVIDDSQYLMANELFDRSGEKGYDKFTDIAKNFRNLIHYVNELEDDNKIVYFLHHTETDSNNREKCKTIGKMLDEKLCVEGCFDIVIYCQDHEFYTQGNGMSSAKSPEGMFEQKIPNDLKAVDTAIREYYGMTGDG